MNVLSLFDGISCGQVALGRAGKEVSKYFASEICKDAMAVTNARFPNTIQLGDVKTVTATKINEPIDLLMGGSPCQGFSMAGKKLNFEDPRSKLFFEFVRILQEIKPRYFLLENVKMDKKSRDVITNLLGVKPIEINSSLVSAQNRIRYYWTNIAGVAQPKDKSIYLRNIIDLKAKRTWVDTSRIKAVYPTTNYLQYDLSGKGYKSQDQRAFYLHKKHGTVPSYGAKSKVKFIIPKQDKRPMKIGMLTPIEVERLQTLPDNYTDVGLSTSKRMSTVGNGWTVDVIAHILANIP
jgi:site-specific DNA-cytosine methylase